VQKADGAFLYGTTDLATLDFREREYKPDRVIYVTDLRQQLHFQQVFSGWRALQEKRGVDLNTLGQLVHVWFGMLRLEEGAMSSRKGNVIRLVDLIDEGVRRAKEVTDEKSGSLSEEERISIAEAVGLSAIRYADLSQNPQTDVQFSWDKLLSFEGNTAPFLMYSYARARGIQRKARKESPDVAALSSSSIYERALVLYLLRFPNAVEHALESCKPNVVCDYLFELSSVFNRFYVESPVLSAETDALRESRLALVEASLRVFQKCFSLLGIQALDRM
jgi:arginyl-tRNA synthetase